MSNALAVDWGELITVTSGLLSVPECEELSFWASKAGKCNALEVGHFTGLSTLVLLHSLENGSRLLTLDHHNGDGHAPKTPAYQFHILVGAFHPKRDVRLEVLFRDFREVLSSVLYENKWGFVFYDAEHTAAACLDFWREIEDDLSDRCVLAYDDADWNEMQLLGMLATAAGFKDCTRRELVRGDGGKRDSNTHTLRVMRR